MKPNVVRNETWPPGKTFVPKTEPLPAMLISCGITKEATGYVTWSDPTMISFYLEKGVPGMGWIEAHCSSEIFGLCFKEDRSRDDVPPGAMRHFAKAFPNDFLIHSV